ncbi:hypothetical protein Scep_016107 [Stephania cephalantha]|uniref:Tryptophan synthase beta chain-like PALP domain-containing protein n=1 Tax=Stephania cephalantha TaxID=152367 RepID=A0AAP0NTW5_9MAGN
MKMSQREDLCGVQLTGNKARKLEFIMADVVAQGCDCVITMGGIQSNHCRATAVAAKYLNLECYLILCAPELEIKDPGLVGNLMIEKLVGANIEMAAWEDFAKFGAWNLLNTMKQKLAKKGRKPYVIPIGASNTLGTWGYIEASREIEQQVKQGCFETAFDDIVAACGSVGTVVGLSLGSQLSTLKAKVHGFCVGEETNNCYKYAQQLLDGLGAGLSSRDLLHLQDAKGLGYATSTNKELAFIKEVAETTGVILDHVYSGKAAFGLWKDMKKNPSKWEGRKVLFVHTGGIFALYDKAKDMSSMVSRCRRLEIDGCLPAKDASHPW